MNNQQSTGLCDIKYKIVFLGQMAVGKSSVIQKFTKGKIDQKHNQTIGIDFTAKNVSFNGNIYRLQLWDTAGQQKFRSLIPAYMKDAHCAVLTYDITDKQTFINCTIWIELFKLYKTQEAIMLLVGNKNDLNQKRQVTFEQGVLLASKYKDMSFIQISAKTGQGVEQLFHKTIQNIFISKASQQKNILSSEKNLFQGSKTQSRINKKTKIKFSQKKDKQIACCYI